MGLAVDEGPFELGQLLFYEDRNDNNTFDQGELLGGAPLHTAGRRKFPGLVLRGGRA